MQTSQQRGRQSTPDELAESGALASSSVAKLVASLEMDHRGAEADLVGLEGTTASSSPSCVAAVAVVSSADAQP